MPTKQRPGRPLSAGGGSQECTLEPDVQEHCSVAASYAKRPVDDLQPAPQTMGHGPDKHKDRLPGAPSNAAPSARLPHEVPSVTKPPHR